MGTRLCLLGATVGALAAFLAGCGGGSARPAFDAEAALAESWTFFETRDYAAAREDFLLVLDQVPGQPEALRGLGWCYAWLDSLPQAQTTLSAALVAEPGAADAHAGLAAVSHLENDGPAAIAHADSVLLASPRYVFAHDSTVTWEDLRVLIAQSAYYEGDFTRALAEVDSLTEGPIPDPDAPTFVTDLMEAIIALASEYGGLDLGAPRPVVSAGPMLP